MIMEPTEPKANPLIAGRRVELERECLRLCAEEAAAANRPSEDVMADASRYKGTFKLNPASMTDDRLLHTVMELRAAKAWREKK